MARYDEDADWYDDWRKPHVESTARDVTGSLGRRRAAVPWPHLAELGDRPVPNTLAIRARKEP